MAACRNARAPRSRRCGARTVRRPAISRSSRRAYRTKHGVSKDDLKRAIAHVSVKSHANGTKNPKAHLQKAITEEQCLNAPMIAEPLGLFDCCGVSDGAACAIVTTPEIARAMGKKDIITVKALQLALSNGLESQHNSWDGSYFHTARIASKRAYEEAGIKNPRDEVSMIEVHDCFSITELVTMEDLHISKEGEGWKDVMNGFYDADGQVPCQIDGGLKCFGHPIGASGLRMLYEMYLQLQGRAGARQLEEPEDRPDAQSRRRADDECVLGRDHRARKGASSRRRRGANDRSSRSGLRIPDQAGAARRFAGVCARKPSPLWWARTVRARRRCCVAWPHWNRPIPAM